MFTGYPMQHNERVLYRGDLPAALPVGIPRLPDGFRISEINDRYADLSTLHNFSSVRAEIAACWPGVEDFRRAGFGFVAHDAEKIVCWCTAEYLSTDSCGIGIETVPEFRGHGFATAAATAIVRHCADRAITPHWDAWASNVPSIAVAEKIGLHKTETYTIFVLDL